ncbi:hypothetical protein F2Q69_00003544 [Brassica cretica]|uniref:Uncharacterized protein n=1 Tax=Brassica cretica TaxID=69181 RepID=A0A8S9PD45_BRACR|nr:hypothetical protein F2Q69_00003544 [Brassica cretica]
MRDTILDFVEKLQRRIRIVSDSTIALRLRIATDEMQMQETRSHRKQAQLRSGRDEIEINGRFEFSHHLCRLSRAEDLLVGSRIALKSADWRVTKDVRLGVWRDCREADAEGMYQIRR